MKKKNLFLVIILLMFIVIIQNVSAKTYKVTRRKDVYHGNDPSRAYYLRYKLNPNDVEESVYVNLYQATIDGIEADTYCVDPGKKYGNDGDYVVKDDTVDPTTNNPRDLAIAGALKEIDNYRKQGVGGDDLKLVGDIAMRWVFMYYGGGISSEPPIYIPGTSVVSVLWKAWKAFSKPEYAYYVNDNEAIIKYAKNVYASAVKAASAGSYSNAVAQGYIYSPEFTSTTYQVTQVVGNTKYITFEIHPKDSSKVPSQMYIDNFEAGCTNKTVKCTVTEKQKKEATYEPAGLLIKMTIDTTNWDKQDFGIYVDPAYCDSKDAASQIVILRKENGDTQRMLAVLPGSCPATPERKIKRPRIPVYGNDCECNYPDGKTWDGTYTLRKYKNGNLIGTETIKQEETSKINEYSCPSADYCKNKTNNTCQKPSESTDGKYHCPNPTLPDGSCTPEDYKEQCTHNCDPDGETDEPDEEKHKNTPEGGFYCKESSPGAGDGQPCSEEEHNAKCHKNYVNCDSVVSLPGTCTELDASGDGLGDGSGAGSVKGVISDINEGDATCAKITTTNQIKKCVLGKTDATNTSYEATNEMPDNSYCKVYCKEKYNFVLPTARLTTSGGYFKLNATVTGTRDCYVASADDSQSPIDETKFNKDLTAKRAELIDAWNDYSHWKTAVYQAENKMTKSQDSYTHDECTDSNTTYTIEEYTYKCYNRDTGKEVTKGCSVEKYYSKACTEHECEDGTDPTEDYTKKRDDALKVLQQKATDLNNIISSYNSCTGAIVNTNYASSLTNADPDSTRNTWNNDMKFDPKIEFRYDNSYSNGAWTDFNKSSGISSSSSESYCTGNINDSYECTTATTSTVPTKDVPILTCTKDGCSTQTYKISSAKWVTKSKTKTSTYRTSQSFSTYTPYGTIVMDSTKNQGVLYTQLPDDALPIKMLMTTGVFKFEFRFSNIGQSNSSQELGRLANANKANGKSVIEQKNRVTRCNDKYEASTTGGYVCHYLNNCTDHCDFSCDNNDPDSCNFNTCDNGKCTVTCTNCIFDGQRTTYSYRTVSLNNLFPNGLSGRGYNWNGTETDIKNTKATDTKKEIEDSGESIYEKAQYSYTLTPSNMKKIRDYNDEVKSFTNSALPDGTASLDCKTVTYGDVTYRVNCKSEFLNLIDTTGKKYATVNERVTKDSDAFILYTTNSNCLDGACLKTGIGPSWKLKGSSKQ